MFNLAPCSTILGTETCLQDLFHFFESYSNFLGCCSTNFGTVPQKVELFHFVSGFLDTAQFRMPSWPVAKLSTHCQLGAPQLKIYRKNGAPEIFLILKCRLKIPQNN